MMAAHLIAVGDNMNENDLQDMRKALGLDPTVKAKETARTPGLKVILSVREKWGGPVLPFGAIVPTLSRLQAQIETEKQARDQGFVVWALIEITQE